ncbi:MAG: rRNA maturation RNase YbeY [Acidobacteria bacterium]|nr:rRNA maturation RNase YbeY [Acidobacteriota bacterium]
MTRALARAGGDTARISEPPDPGSIGGYAISCQDERDEPAAPVDCARLERLAARALASLGVPSGAAISILVVGPARMSELKGRFLGSAEETDVLAFPVDDPGSPSPGPVVLGDVVLCPEFAQRQARALGRRPDGERELLLVHGILHLLGHDHADRRGEWEMSREERAILLQWGEAR